MDALSQLVDAFAHEDVEEASALAAALRPESHRKLDPLIEELQGHVDGAAEGVREPLGEILKRLKKLVQIKQSVLKDELLPRIRSQGKRYRKFREVLAKRASPGDRVVSITSDGRETENVAKPGDWHVRNTTGAGEEYLIGKDKFAERYRHIEDVEDGWARYQPVGEVFAVEVDDGVLELLGRSGTFYIEAPWGESQKVSKADELATPPAFDEVYRIARKEFGDTYKRV